MVYDMARAINPPVNALGAYAQGMKLGEEMRQQKSKNALMDARKEYGRKAFTDSQGEGGQFDADAYAKAVAQDAAAAGDFDYFSNAQDVVGKSQTNRINANKDNREGEKHQFEQLGSQLKLQGQLLGGVRDQATWDQALQTARANGIDVSNIPTQFDPKVVQDITQMTLTAQDRLEQEWKRKGFDLDVAKFGYQQRNDAMNRSVTIRGQNLSQGQGKAPTGYRWKQDGSLEPIPGGPKDAGDKAQMRRQIVEANAKNVLDATDKALEIARKSGWKAAGYLGPVMSQYGGTDARTLEKTIDTIKANLGFDALQQMRDSSPTGGALGQVAVQELAMLQSTVASLDNGLPADELVANLEKVQRHYQNMKNIISGSMDDSPSLPEQGGPTTQTVMKAPPNPRDHAGKIIRDENGQRMQSDGETWRILK